MQKVETEKYGLVNADDFRKLNMEFKSMVQKNIPGFENDLYLDRDWLGDVVAKFSVISSYTEDPVNIEAAKIGYAPTKVKKKINVNAYSINTDTVEGDLDYGIPVDVPLKEKEYAILAYHTGKLTKEYLNDLINSEEYLNETDQTYKLYLFKREVSNAKQDAKLDFKNDEIYPAIEARAEILASKKWTKQQGDKKIN